MNTESDCDEAEYLKDYLAGRLRSKAVVKNITGTLAENLDFKGELCTSDCLILISSRQASSLIQDKCQETQGNYITFDRKVIQEEYTRNKELVGKMIVVCFTAEDKNN